MLASRPVGTSVGGGVLELAGGDLVAVGEVNAQHELLCGVVVPSVV